MPILIKLIAGIVGIVVLAVGGLGVYLSRFFDPNEYKGLIEEQARTHAGVELGIEGDLGWSVFPWLGLEIGRVTVAVPGAGGSEQLAEVEAVQVAVKLVPLLSGSLQVKGVLVDGLQADLRMDKDGRGNWEAIGAGTAGGKEAGAAPGADEQAGGPAQLPEITIGRIEVKDGRLHFEDAAAGQKVDLSNLQLVMQQVTLGKPFPLELAFSLALADPQLKVDGKLSAKVTAEPAAERYTLTDLVYASTVAGAPLGGKSVPVGLGGNLSANLKQQEAKLEEFYVELDQLRANLHANARNFLDKPEVDGRIDMPSFDLVKLLAAVGQPAVATADSSVLTAVAAGFNLRFADDKARLENLKLQLDDTTLEGTAQFNTATQAVFFRLAGTEMNVDRYLPPAAEGDAGQAGGNGAAAPAAADGEMIPVETLRGLDIDGQFKMNKVVASNLTIENIELVVLAKKGLVEIRKAAGQLYDGSFASSGKVNVRGKTPLLHVTKNLQGVDIGKLLKDLSNEERVAGKLTLNGDFTTQGNSQQAFMRALGGNTSLDLQDGEVRGINVSALMCKGLARANKQDVDTSAWPAVTSIDSAKGSMVFVNGVGTNNDLVIETGGAQVTGAGSIDLGSESLDYRTEVKVIGRQLGNTTTNEAGEEVFVENTACQVPEKYQAAAVPMRCKGSFSDDPAKLCTLDFAGLLKAEAQRRINEKIDEKVGDKLKEKLGDQMGEDLGNKLKGLFGR